MADDFKRATYEKDGWICQDTSDTNMRNKMKRYNKRVAKMKLKDKDRNDYWMEEDEEYYE